MDGILGKGEHADELRALFSSAYAAGNTMAEATRYILNSLFGEYGLVVLDPDDARLKKELVSIAIEDITEQVSSKLIQKTTTSLSKEYKPQMELRDINFFYLKEGLRERIILDKGKYSVNKTDISFSEDELKGEIEEHPERFSPNVALRPVYQEKILPNLAYLGGPGEVAYWMQLKEMFEHYKINYPVVMLRSSALWIDTATHSKMKKLGVEATSLFDKEKLEEKERTESEQVDLSTQRQQIAEIYDAISIEANKLEGSLEKAVKGALKKQLDQLDNLEKKLQKAADRKGETVGDQKIKLRSKLFPAEGPQERYDNFIPYYLQYGEVFITTLKDSLLPLQQHFTIIIDDQVS